MVNNDDYDENDDVHGVGRAEDFSDTKMDRHVATWARNWIVAFPNRLRDI